METTKLISEGRLEADDITRYRRRGFLRVKNMFTREEALGFRQHAMDHAEHHESRHKGGIFAQFVNAWQHDDQMRDLTLHPRIAACARLLTGVDLRLWHDQILIKEPHNGKATEFHQDQPYWPHADSHHPITCWLALGNVTVEHGCMTFLAGTHQRDDLPVQMLHDRESLFSVAPDLRWHERVTVPLQAGDCTFHHGRCAHMATPNLIDEARVAHAIIFIDRDTVYSGQHHVVTDPLELERGQRLEGELFPEV